MSERILRIVRGESTEIYRVRLLPDGSAGLERFEHGFFGPMRIFQGGPEASGFEAAAPNTPAKMKRCIAYITGFLDGAVKVGERELLSPTSALTRNVRWFPGDIQMLRTSFFYVRELFPSAQFHVTQLFRRVFGDVTFLALVVLSAGLWLRTDAPVARVRLAVGLQLLSMIAIIGLDRYWEPLRLRLRRLREAEGPGGGWRRVWRWPALLAVQLVVGTATVAVQTLLGLANLVIHPLKLWESWRQLARGRALEWKASSVSAGQDVRGWPLDEFRTAYGPAVKVGWGATAFGLWLVTMGAPVGLLGLNGVGLFLASFLTVVLYAWCSGLPRTSEGIPRYRLPRKELGALLLAGLIGSGLSVALIHQGLYPLPGFEGSLGVVALFVSLSALLALVFPFLHLAKQHLARRNTARPRAPAGRGDRDDAGAATAFATRSRTPTLQLARAGAGAGAGARPAAPGPRPPRRAHRWPAVLGIAVMTILVTWQIREGLPLARPLRFLHVDETAWRMPEPERRLYEEVERIRRRHGQVDPEPLLRSEADQPTLALAAGPRSPDLRELRGIPAPRLPRLGALTTLALPELFPLPARERTVVFKPRRHFVEPVLQAAREPASPVESGRRATEVAQRRAAAVTPRHLSRDELRLQEQFIAGSHFPWISWAELRRLGQPDGNGESIPLAELARAYRWEVVRELWDEVPAARRGGVSEQVRYQRLRDGIEGVIAIGRNPTGAEVERYLGEELALVERWSRLYPHLPLGALRESPFTTASRFSQVTRFLLDKGLSRDQLANAWRLDYVDAYWDAASGNASIHQIFRERPRTLPWELFELDWDGNAALERRWTDLETEQALAMKVWRAAPSGGTVPTPQQLRTIVQFLEKVLGSMLAAPGDGGGPYGGLARLFRLEGVDPQAFRARDPAAALWASRVWTEAMAGRVAETVYRASAEERLPGTAADRALVQEIARTRYPDDGGDPMLRRVFEWLVLVDSAQTFSELAAGYDQFARELGDRGIPPEGMPSAPRIPEPQLFGDLVGLWRALPARFPHIPARDDMVAELICHMAYFSSRNGRDARTPGEFLDDFAPRLAAVDRLMPTAPPPAIQALADQTLESTLGRSSPSPLGRRFFAWWMVATETSAVQNDLDRHQIRSLALPAELARAWAEIIDSGGRRWPRMPWASPGFSAFYLGTRTLEGWTVEQLWQRFGSQLTEADGLMARHVVPARTLESLVERRIQEKTGALPLDPTLRRANAVMALARLLEVARLDHVDEFGGNPGRLAERLSLLYEKVSHDYPHLYWDGEGMLEWYLLVGLRQSWGLGQTVARFAPEWSLAETLAASGWRARFEAVARQNRDEGGRGLGGDDRALAEFMDVQARRLELRTGLALDNPRSRAMNALMALSALVLAAGEEGQIPEQHGLPWSQTRVRAWASGLEAGKLRPATLGWVKSLVGTWAELFRAMREEGPRFPWYRGSIVETNLLAMGNAKIPMAAMREGRRQSWRIASELFDAGFVAPPPFQAMVLAESRAELRRKLAAARGVAEAQVSEAELAPEDPALGALNATLVLADVLGDIRAAYGQAADPASVARRIVEVQALGRQRFGAIPWLAKGFTPAFVVAAHRKDFRDDPWKYAELIDLPEVNRLLGELGRRGAHGEGLPSEVVRDVAAMMREQTGRTPSSPEVVTFQALRDGSLLLREFLPKVPRSLDNVITLARLRTAVRALDGEYPELHVVKAEDDSARTGFAERLAVLAMKLGLEAGRDPGDPTFVPSSVELVQQRYLESMSKIYAPLRATLTPEEVQLYRETIRDEVVAANPARAARFGLAPEALSVPDVKQDDLVADSALYEILYASEIGQDQTYLTDLFSIVGVLRGRPESERVYREGLATIDQQFSQRSAPDGQRTASPEDRPWWTARAAFLRATRGQTIAIARTLALVKRKAFGPDADPETRASFARFGSFDDYLGLFLDAFEEIPRVPELGSALSELGDEDAFLADGLRFALALLKCHVLDRLYPAPGAAGRALRDIAAQLPAVSADYWRVLGFAPRLESGVPLYDARMSFLRRDLTRSGGSGSDVYRRLNLVQRGVQRWTEAYFLEQAYKVLFFHALDSEDPTAVPRPGATGPLALPRTAGLRARADHLLAGLRDRVLDRALPRTRGDETTTFVESQLPEVLAAATGSQDLSVWIGWLMQHGEIGLDGRPTGRNPYAEEIAGYEARLAHYRARIAAGIAAGHGVRAEEQRIRDIEREYDSFQKQVGWLVESSRASAPLTARARQDYREAIWLHAVLPLALVLGLALLLRWGGGKLRLLLGARPGGFGPARVLVGVAFVWLPLVLALGIPLGVALRPAQAASLAPRLLERARLLERDPDVVGRFRPRGAAAQLTKLCPRGLPIDAPEVTRAP